MLAHNSSDFSYQSEMIPAYDVHDLAVSNEVLVNEKDEDLVPIPMLKHSIVRVQKSNSGNANLQINVIIRRESSQNKNDMKLVLSSWSDKDVCLSNSNNYYKMCDTAILPDERKNFIKSVQSEIDQLCSNFVSPTNLSSGYENDLPSTSMQNPCDDDKERNSTTDFVRIVLPVNIEKSTANGKCRVLPSSMSDTGKFPCPQEGCSSILASATALRKHRLVHQPKRFSCSKCGKEFVERTKLKRHMLVHTRVQPFACNHEGCTKLFSLKSNLKAHMKTHTGEKQYKCMHCSHAFSHPYNLKVHLLRRHPNQQDAGREKV